MCALQRHRKSCNTRENGYNFKSTSIPCVVSLNIQKTPESRFFFLLLFFITSTLSKMSQVQKHSKVMLPTFPKSLGVGRGLELLTSAWENSFHLGHWKPTNIVKGDDDDDDEAVCLQRGEKWEKIGAERFFWGGAKDCLALKCIMVELSRATQLGRPWVSTINLHTHWYYT